jgi:hypothetical protein
MGRTNPITVLPDLNRNLKLKECQWTAVQRWHYSLVGAIYVRDQLHRLEQFADDIGTENLLSLMDVSFPGLGLVDGQRVTHMRLQMEVPQVLIEPDLMEFGIFDFQQAKPMMQRGYDAAQVQMEDIKGLIDSSKSQGNGYNL